MYTGAVDFRPLNKTQKLKPSGIITVLLLTLLLVSDTYSQRINYRRLLELYGQGARTYFLSANRPSYGVSAYTNGKGDIQVSTGLSYAEDFLEVPLDISYGITDRLEIFGGLNSYTRTYNFEGDVIGGVGDANIGVRYKFHENDYFSNAFQTLVKLPTASKTSGLGTGKFDFYFGLGHSYSSQYFGYDVSVEGNLLHRRDFPGTGQNVPAILRNALDSIKKSYDYTYEPEVGFSIGPSVYPTSRSFIYAGYSFTRNTKLNYNTSSIYGGAGFSSSNLLSLSAGVSYGLEEDASLLVSLGVTFNFLKKMY